MNGDRAGSTFSVPRGRPARRPGHPVETSTISRPKSSSNLKLRRSHETQP